MNKFERITSEPQQVIQAFKSIAAAFINKAESSDPLTADQLNLIKLVEPICDDLNEYLKFLRNEAEDVLNANKPLYPSYLLLAKSGVMCPMIMQQLPEKKGDVALFVSCMTAVFNTAPVDAYSFMSEVYIAPVSKEEVESKSITQPSQHPNREDAVVIRVANQLGTQFCVYKILVDENGKKTLSTENMISPEEKGKHANILMDNFFEISKSLKEIASDMLKDELATTSKRKVH